MTPASIASTSSSSSSSPADQSPSIDAGATAFVGSLQGYPGDSFEYYVPYDAIDREIPGVWVATR